MSIYKINYFFFLFTVGIPLLGTPLVIILFWPLIFNPYQLLPPLWTLFGSVLFGASILWFIVSYIAMPWLVVIKGDRFIFHRLFRRKLVVKIDKIRRIEFMTKRLPVEEHRWYIEGILCSTRKMEGGYS